MFLRKIGFYVQICMALQPRSPTSTGFELLKRKLFLVLTELKQLLLIYTDSYIRQRENWTSQL